MKKLTALLLAAVILLMGSGCSSQKPEQTETPTQEQTEETAALPEGSVALQTPDGEYSFTAPPTLPENYDEMRVEPTEQTIPVSTYANGDPYTPFGAPNTKIATTSQGTVTFSVNLMEVRSERIYDDGILMEVKDSSNNYYVWLGIVDLASEDPAASLEDVFPTVENVIKTMLRYDGTIDLDHSESVEVNGKDFFQVRYKYQYKVQNELMTKALIGYTTRLSNGAYVYWLVSEISGTFTAARKAAENMAITFQEI